MRKKISVLLLFSLLIMTLSLPALAAQTVQRVTASVYPLTPNTASQYTIGFYTSSTGALAGGSGDIIITFPQGTTLPSSIASGKVMVNGKSISSSDLDTDENILTIELPNDLSVAAGGYVGIIIPESAGIRTPTQAGSQYIKVSTSKDSAATSNAITMDGTKISSLEVAVSPGAIDEYAAYEINFNTSSKGALSGGEDFIYIEFPEKVNLPSSISSSYITVNGKKPSSGDVDVERDKNLVTIQLPDDVNISNFGTVKVMIGVDAHIRNPEESGDYELQVYTSRDAYYRAEEYSVGVTVSAPVVQVSPESTNTAAQYSIGFTTSAEGALEGGDDYIYLYFPEGTYMPSSISKTYITVNGYEASSVSVSRSDLKISIKLPASVDISNNSYVGVVVNNKAGVKNPTKSGKYRLAVSTSSDNSKANSQEYNITGSSSNNGGMDINLSTLDIGKVVEVNLMIEAGSLGELEAGDELTLDFSNDFEFPASISVTYITINGQKVTACKISGRDLELTLPADIDEGDDIEIIISDSAGIKNPEKAGEYDIELASPEDSLYATIKIGSTAAAKPAVILNNNKAGIASQYSITLIADEDLDWDEEDILTIKFPQGTTLPTSISAEKIAIGSTEAKRVIVSGNNLQLYLGENLSLEEGEQFIFVIPEFVGIKNPATAGSYTLTLELPGDEDIQSQNYTIVGSSTSPVTTGKKIVFRIGSKLATDGGTLVNMDTAPTIINNFTVVPLRALGNALGAETVYDSAARTITVKYNGKEIIFIVDSKMVKLNNQWVTLDVAATLVNNRVMIPARFVSQSYGATVQWDAVTQEVIITK